MGRTCGVLSIGHSNHAYARFLELLRGAGVDAIVDVRSVPHSRRVPHFNLRSLELQLPRDGIEYHYLGRHLGGRPAMPELFRNGRADYERMAQTPEFRGGLDAVQALTDRHAPALMCAERDPLDCHRCLLVARALAARGTAVAHILADGDIATQVQIEDRLLELSGARDADLFASRGERIALAYADRAGGVAYAAPAR
jgi:uncharacterized protein (DUF488 family)